MVYEPHRVLECLQSVGFQGKNCFTKTVSNFSEIDFGIPKHKKVIKKFQKILLWHFGICPGQCTTDGREYELSPCPIKEARFKKMSLTKSLGDFW